MRFPVALLAVLVVATLADRPLASSAPWTSHVTSAAGAGIHVRHVQSRSLTAMQQWNEVAVNKVASVVQNAYKQIQVQDDNRPSDQCIAAFQEFAKALGIDITVEDPTPAADSCAARMQTLWEFNDTTLPTEASLEGWCRGCASPIKKALTGLSAACASEEGFSGFDRIEKLLAVVLDLPCLRANGKYCLPEFLNGQKAFREIGDNVTATQLDAVCTVCVQAYVNLIREFEQEFKNIDDFTPSSLSRGPGGMQLAGAGPSVRDDVPFDVLCLQVNGEYCVVSFDRFRETDHTNRTEEIEQLCHPCTRLFVNKQLEFMKEEKISGNDRKEFERFAESLPAVCAKNANGERCGLLADKGAGNTPPLDAVGNACKQPFTNNQVCPNACKSALETYIATAGCCSRAIFEFIELDDKNFNATKAIEYANTSCSLPLMAPVCLPEALKVTVVTLTNIKKEYFLANQAAILEAVAKDVAKTLGIPVSDVTVTLKNAISNVNKHSLLSRGSMRLLAGDSYELNVGIKAYDDADSTLLANKLAEAQKEGTLSTASLGQTVPSSGKVDPNKPFANGEGFEFSGVSTVTTSLISLGLAGALAMLSSAF